MSLQNEIIEKIIRPCLLKAGTSIPNLQKKGDISSRVFYGQEGAILDSLNLVNFIFLIEEQVLNVFKINLKFETEDILNTELRPFLNISNLAAFIENKMKASQ